MVVTIPASPAIHCDCDKARLSGWQQQLEIPKGNCCGADKAQPPQPSPPPPVTLSPWNSSTGSEAVHRFSWHSKLLSRTLY